ncbi:MAG TPA: acyltransferase, partial [Sulfitobacter sp.]|nr:acyltransferase [Sulfitobacter sp.]
HFDVLEARIEAEAKAQNAYRYVSLIDALDFDQDALLQGDCLTFWDVDHFSPCGEHIFGPTIADLVLGKAPLTQ